MCKSHNYMFTFFLWIVLFFINEENIQGKVYQGQFYLKKNEKIHFLTKFSCNIGTCQFSIKMKLRDNITAKLLNNYYKLNNKTLKEMENDKDDGNNHNNNKYDDDNNNNNNRSNKLLHMDYDNAYYVLSNQDLEYIPQRITLMQDIEQRYVNKNDKCYAFGNLKNSHMFNIPFYFKYSDLVNSKTYNLKNFINNKYSMSFNAIHSELKNNKLLQSEILNYGPILNEKNSNYAYKEIYAKTTHRVHVWFLMFDDCYDNFIRNLKLNIKTKLAYWEYLLHASKKFDISSLNDMDIKQDTSYNDFQNEETEKDIYSKENINNNNNNNMNNNMNEKKNKSIFYKSFNFDKITLLENPKRFLFLEEQFTKSEINDISFFLKYYQFKKMKNFNNMYNNLYKNGYYEQVIDYIYQNEGFHIEYEVNIFQTNKSHFSYELLYSPILTFILTILYILLIFNYGNTIIQNITSKSHKHAMILSVAIVIFIQLLSNSLLLIHLFVYSKNGIGIEFFKISFNILNFLAQIIMCTMLLSLSYGFTIFEASFDIILRIKVIFIIITIFHVILVILDNTYIMETSSKFFDNDNVTGYIIFVLRISLAILYHFNINNLFTMSKITPIRKFLKKLYVYGLFYIFSFPIIFIICYIFDTYWRQRFMLFGTALLQFISTYFITKMSLTNSEYFKVSDMSASDLPGATSSWFNQKIHTY
ncbi:hypothetical protein PFFCH_02445 [Plasmodium falciparum FCH/4]|uniref:GPR180/TMEM145 transmembrane domain-containing protein n=1 Tax=Plasmodium falciparum FCH/4 TaxID=1036724 RepID=A0A024VN22_PLAFA|nr:hypothetical protein PFFCH_02445 [Plasmodium falciparum FCH/4]